MLYKNAFQSKILCAAVAVATLAPATSQAQDWIGLTPMDYANMNMNFSNTLINNAMIERMTRGDGSSSARRSGVTTTETGSKVGTSPASFSYTITPAQRTAYRNAYLANLAKSKPTLAASLRIQFEKHDYNTIYNGLLTGTSLTSNNLADAFTAYTVLGWMVVNGHTSDPSPTSVAGVRRQWANALASTGFATNEDSRRRTAEELKIKMVLLHAGWQDAKKTKQSAAYANAVDRLFQSQLKLKMQSMMLSASGLKIRG